MTPPRPVLPAGAAPQPAPKTEPAAEVQEAGWDDLLLGSTPTAESYSAVEEAAVLYANTRVAEAIAVLETFLRENTASRDLQPWLLLFDLYQSQGMKQKFDELSMEFVVRFERSAPVWEPPNAVPSAPVAASAPAAGPTVRLEGMLDGGAEQAIQRLLKLAEGKVPVRLDLAQAQGIDPSRAQLLAEVLLMLRKAGKYLVLAGAQEFTARVKAYTEGAGRREPAYWRLLFELYQFQNRAQEFEDAAVDYAVTFEVSPPSWEPVAGLPAEPATESPASPAQTGGEVESDVFRLEGVLDAASEYRLKELARFAEGRSEVVVDLSRLVRVDFMIVGSVINTLINLNQAGKKVTLSGQNEMVHALFEVMGVRDFAQLARRKAR
ncbi:STAS domain-containing protein [Thiobacter aerophilum]|uniref:STAS domain-containing protein n=1 Tax=Thiobacter aerophilum TaxID=3121275 RepID=A0ABV0EG04_9BURK